MGRIPRVRDRLPRRRVVAGCNRELVDRYLHLAEIAQRASTANYEATGDDEYGGGIDSDVGELVRTAGEALVDHVWHPWRGRRGMKRALATSREKEAVARKKKDRMVVVDWGESRI